MKKLEKIQISLRKKENNNQQNGQIKEKQLLYYHQEKVKMVNQFHIKLIDHLHMLKELKKYKRRFKRH